MSLLDDLKGLGVDVEEGLQRFMGNAPLYERMMMTFPKMMEKTPVDLDFDASDVTGIIEVTHSIKGATGNLSLTPLYEAYTKAVDLLRGGRPEEARQILKDIQPVQTQIMDCIKSYIA